MPCLMASLVSRLGNIVNDQVVRLIAITMLASGTEGAGASPAAQATPTPRPPLAEEEDQAVVLQRPVTIFGPLAQTLGAEQAPIGRVLHAAVQERSPGTREAAREAALDAMRGDPAIEAAYLSTLVPVEDGGADADSSQLGSRRRRDGMDGGARVARAVGSATRESSRRPRHLADRVALTTAASQPPGEQHDQHDQQNDSSDADAIRIHE
jgi:hypothetical protein